MISDIDIWGMIEDVKYRCAKRALAGQSLHEVSELASQWLDEIVLSRGGDMCDRAIVAYFVVEELYQRYGLDLPLDLERSPK